MADANLGLWQTATDNRFKAGQEGLLEAIPDLATANSASLGAASLQAGTATSQGDLSKSLADRVGTFNGLQDQYAADAFGANSADKQKQASDQATAGVAGKFDNIRMQGQRASERKGVAPGSGAALALSGQYGIAQAAAEAGAAGKARADLSAVAADRQKTAIGFGANLPGQSTQAAQVSGILGERAAGSASAPLKNKLDFAGGISNLYGNAAEGYKGLWQSQNLTPGQQSLVTQNDQARADAQDAALLKGIVQIASSDVGSSYIEQGLDYLFS